MEKLFTKEEYVILAEADYIFTEMTRSGFVFTKETKSEIIEVAKKIEEKMPTIVEGIKVITSPLVSPKNEIDKWRKETAKWLFVEAMNGGAGNMQAIMYPFIFLAQEFKKDEGENEK